MRHRDRTHRPALPHLRRSFACAAAVAAALLSASASEPVDIERFREAAAKWEDDIAAFEQLDAEESHPGDSVLFVGSSSIRMWDGIDDDIAPYHPIKRGYGGAKFSDLVFYAERIIHPHEFQALVLFVGNDVAGKESDRTPDEVAELFRHVIGTVRTKFPETPVFYVAVTPTPSRWDAWPDIRAANLAVQQVCEELPHTHFIATESVFFDAGGKPRTDLFLDDRLHQNQAGYDRWSAVIKSHLDTVLGAR